MSSLFEAFSETTTGRRPWEPMVEEDDPLAYFTPMPPEPDDDDPRTTIPSMLCDGDFDDFDDEFGGCNV